MIPSARNSVVTTPLEANVQHYPRWKHHATKPSLLVRTAEQEMELGAEWHDNVHDAKGATTRHIDPQHPAHRPRPTAPEITPDAPTPEEQRIAELLDKAASDEQAEATEEAEATPVAETPDAPVVEKPVQRPWKKR